MKRIWISAAAALCLTLRGMLINYRAYQSGNYLKWSFKMHGGECTLERGFGLSVFHVYPMTMDGTSTHSLSLDPISFLLSIAILTALIWGILTAVSFFRNSRPA
ncbi:MAG: hypothetical protein K6A40_01280 [Solobacterium sp.]|nr:hypothetical protein [Solobacterium sp.]